VGLAAHGRWDLIRNHILNQLFVIERYSFLLTGNRVYYLSPFANAVASGECQAIPRTQA